MSVRPVLQSSSADELWHLLSAQRPLPLRFVLHQSQRPNGSLCPCLEVDLPKHGGSAIDHDNVSQRQAVCTVTRILDPEHKMPYVSLGGIFAASGMSIIEGLLRFQIAPLDYQLSLAGLEPFDDIWVSLKLAAAISSQLGLSGPLAALLDPKTRPAWSLDEGRTGISFNWRVPASILDEAKYSTASLLQTDFPQVELLRPGEQLKLLVSDQQRAEARSRSQSGAETNRLKVQLIRCSTACYAVWLDLTHAQQSLDAAEHAQDPEALELEIRLARDYVSDLRVEQLPPLATDLIEWIQLAADPFSVVGDEQKGPVRVPALDRLDRAEMLLLRQRDEAKLQSQHSSNASLHEVKQALEVTILIVRSKLVTLHKMQMLAEHLSLAIRVEPLQVPRTEPADIRSRRQTGRQPVIDDLLTSIRGIVQDVVTSEQESVAPTQPSFEALTRRVDSLSKQIQALAQSSNRHQHQHPHTSYDTPFLRPYEPVNVSISILSSIVIPVLVAIFAFVLLRHTASEL